MFQLLEGVGGLPLATRHSYKSVSRVTKHVGVTVLVVKLSGNSCTPQDHHQHLTPIITEIHGHLYLRIAALTVTILSIVPLHPTCCNIKSHLNNKFGPIRQTDFRFIYYCEWPIFIQF